MSDTSVDRLNEALVGRYRIKRQLGEGGMAIVYLAEDLRHERNVALKVLKPELSAVIGGERFLAEIKTTANLQHPHILPLFDSGEAGGFLFYVMPYVEGESLRERVEREKQLPVDEAVGIAKAVARALQAAHDEGVIHRDIKPANILLSRGEPLVADFGIALAVSAAGGGRLTETGLSLGTPFYMSPEQASADRDPDVRSDVYSLGCVLYEMLTGEPPYTGASAQSVLVRILTEDPRPVTDVRKSVPENVAATLARALEKLPADRFESAAAFARALDEEGFRHSRAVPSPAVAAPAGAARPAAGGRPWTRDVRTIGLAALAVVLGVWGWTGRSTPTAQPAFRLSLDLDEIVPDVVGDIVVSPDGTALAVAGRVGDRWSLLVRRADEERFRAVPGTETARYPAFSPDGAWIVFREFPTHALLKVATAGGAPLTVMPEGVVENPRFPDWGDRDNIVFVGADGLYSVPGAGGQPRRVWEGPQVEAQFPRWLPDERGVLVTNSTAGSVAVLDLESGEMRPLIPEGVDAIYSHTGHLLYAHPDGGLFAAAFDVDALAVVGPPIPVIDGVWMVSGPNTPARARYSLSRNGTLIYGAGGGSGLEDHRSLVIADFSGRNETVPLNPRDFESPRWAPDGRSIAYVSGGHVYAYDVELGTLPRQLTFEGTNGDPAWSPDGARVVFSSGRDGTAAADLFVKTVGDDRPAEPLLSLPGNQIARGWSAQGIVVFESGPGANTELWRAPSTDPDSASAWLRSEADLDDIAVSPDGRWAAYQSDETGVEEVYVRRFPDPGQQIPVSEGGGQFPRWSPDGGRLYYWGAESAVVDTLWAADLSTEPTLTVRSREVVAVGSYLVEDWDLHPAGDRFIAAQAAGSEGPGERFLVVVNFFEELRARAGRPR